MSVSVNVETMRTRDEILISPRPVICHSSVSPTDDKKLSGRCQKPPAQCRCPVSGCVRLCHNLAVPHQAGPLSLVHIPPDTVLSLVHITPDTVLSLVHIPPDTVLSLVHIPPDNGLSLVHITPDTVLSLVHIPPDTVLSLVEPH